MGKEDAETERLHRHASERELAIKKQLQERETTTAARAQAERENFLHIIERPKEYEQQERKLKQETQHQLSNCANVVRAQNAKNENQKQQYWLEKGKIARQELEEDRLTVKSMNRQPRGIQDRDIEKTYQHEFTEKNL